MHPSSAQWGKAGKDRNIVNPRNICSFILRLSPPAVPPTSRQPSGNFSSAMSCAQHASAAVWTVAHGPTREARPGPTRHSGDTAWPLEHFRPHFPFLYRASSALCPVMSCPALTPTRTTWSLGHQAVSSSCMCVAQKTRNLRRSYNSSAVCLID